MNLRPWSLALLALTVSTVSGSCASKKPTALVVAISTEAKVPVEVDRMDVTVHRGGDVKYYNEYNLRKGERLPGTLTLSRDEDASSSSPIEVVIRARLDDGTAKREWKVLRRAVLGFSDEKTKLLRMPLRYSCFDFKGLCKDTETCIGGACASALLQVDILPDFVDEKQVVATAPTDPSGGAPSECFLPSTCLAKAVPFPHAQGQCTYDLPFEPGQGNLAMRWAATPGRIVVLDQDPEEGYTVDKKKATLAPGLCAALDAGNALQLLSDASCLTKSPGQPECAPPAPPPDSPQATCDPQPETCNGKDDDCDGVVDNDLTDTFQPCVALQPGACSTGRTICTDGTFSCESELPPQPEICGNNVDEDCDGTPDQGCICNDGDSRSCYSGPDGTDGVGPCKAGTQTCSNQAWGDCADQVLPTEETCDGVADADCTGDITVVCDCTTGAIEECYSGPTQAAGVGICTQGTRTCENSTWGACSGDVQPEPAEICDNQVDDNCDGNIDEDCTCSDGLTQACFGGPSTSRNIGICSDGVQTCLGGVWGPCEGEVLPLDETCDGAADENCDGVVDENCPTCNPDDMQPCYSGPPGTETVAPCQTGNQTCDGTGHWGACTGETVPIPEDCANSVDDDCDGLTDAADNECP